jgi:glycosyltransferase involved in cell wall biosynthesis
MKKKKRKIKVLYIATAFSRNPSDTITPWLTKTIRKLNEKGLEVNVFTSAYKGMTYNKIFGIKVFRFRYFIYKFERLTHEEMTLERMKKGLLYKILPFFYLFFGTIAIIRHCLKRKYDIIHVHWPFPHFLFGYIAAKICRAKLVSTFHSVGLHYIKKSPFSLESFIRLVINKSNIVTVNSSYTGEILKKYKSDNIKIIPFGSAVKSKDDLNYNSESKVTKLLFVGRLVERKGVEYLLEAMKMLDTKVKLIIVGDGNQRRKLEQKKELLELTDNEIVFKGKVSEDELINQYKTCDIFVLPAIVDSKGDTEGLGVVLLEAMSFQKPVIASRVGGIIDIIKDKKTGLLVEEKSPTELSEAIKFFINNPKKRIEIAKRGFIFQQQNFSWEKIIDLLMNCYKGILKE